MIKIGIIDAKTISLLGLDIPMNTPIYLGETNISHMISRHPIDYNKYGNDITNIISSPDYVGHNASDDSIEYVKEYVVDNEFVKVAVRVSTNGKYFTRSLYCLNNNRVDKFIKNGTLKKY